MIARAARLRLGRVLVMVVCAGLAAAAVTLWSIDPVMLEVQSNLACVLRDQQHAELSEVVLNPGWDEHRSSITFHGVDPAANVFELCLDGVQVGVPPHSAGQAEVQFSLRTTWVDLLAARGLLEEYKRSSHWQLYWYTCTVSDAGHYACL